MEIMTTKQNTSSNGTLNYHHPCLWFWHWGLHLPVHPQSTQPCRNLERQCNNRPQGNGALLQWVAWINDLRVLSEAGWKTGKICYMCMLSHVWVFCDPRDCTPPGSSVHGTSQARILGWIAISWSRGSSQPRDRTHISCISCIAGGFFTIWTNREAH